jgi:TP901 family phage tail tape measure protein
VSSRFVLTAQLQLQAPSNVKSVVNQIKKQLRDINIDVQVETSAKAVRQINQVTKATQEATTAAEKMGSAFGISLKRFAAFSIASRAIGLFSTKLSGAIDDAVSFQNEMVRLAQVTGKSLDQLKGVSDQIGVLSSTLGVASKDILGVTTILAQAGIEAQDLTVAINTLAKTSLSPTFGKIEDTAEGAVALLAQFGEGVGALERQLGAINKVSAKFAVESEDLVSVIRRSGGVFKASGGNLEELLALFTSVRATTRESAESIATGLRTIFTRIQRPATIQFLKQFGVELLDLEGKFVGPYKAFEQLSSALSGLEEGDVTFIRIAEELGGFRQIGKVIPLLRQFETAEKARQAAIEGGDSLNQDVITAQQSIQVQFTKTREAFLKLIREIADTSSFKILVQTSLDFANALIKVADSIKPLLPLIGAFAAVKFAQGAGSFIAGIGSGFKRPVGPTGKNAGGKIHAFARGGLVPGTGNRDTVPAMLSPGEFVIRKSSVESIGANNLANVNKYAAGGPVKAVLKDDTVGGLFLEKGTGGTQGINKPINLPKGQEFGSGFPQNLRQVSGDIGIGLLSSKPKKALQDVIKPNLERAILEASRNTIGSLNIAPFIVKEEEEAARDAINRVDLSAIEGYIFEAYISALSGAKLSDPGATWDFVNPSSSVRKRLDSLFASPVKGRLLDAKRTQNSESVQSGDSSIANKVLAAMKNGLLSPSDFEFKPADKNLGQKTRGKNIATKRGAATVLNKHFGGIIQKFAKGGDISGQDTVPALLTPGEFVINKASAQRIGYGRLNNMNKKGVKGFAMGGPVGVQKFADGRRVRGSNYAEELLAQAEAEIAEAFDASTFGKELRQTLKKRRQNIRDNIAINESLSGVRAFEGKGASSSSGGSSSVSRGRSSAQLEPEIQKTKKEFNLLTDRASQLGFIFAGLGATLGDTETGFGRVVSSITTLGATVSSLVAGFNVLTGSSLTLVDVFKGSLNKGSKTLGGAISGSGGGLFFNRQKRDPNESFRAQFNTRRKGLGIDDAKSLTGRAGQFLGNAASRGGFLGRTAGIAGRGLSALGAGGLAGGAIGALSKLAGPIGIAVTGFQLVNGAIGAFADYQGQANKAIEEGSVARAKELSVLAEAPAIITLFGQDASKAFINTIGNLFGGDTVAIIEANAEAQALSAKTNKEYADNVKKADLALRDFEVGLIDAEEYIKTLSANFNNVAAEFEATQTLNAGKAANKSGGFTGGVRNLLSITGLVESSGARNARLDKEIKESGGAAENKLSQEIETLKKGTQIYSNAIFAAGGDVDKVVAVLKEKSPELFKAFDQYGAFGKKQEAQFKKELANQAKSAELRRKAAEALNLGLFNVAGKAETVSGQLANILEGQSGASRIDQAIRTVELAITKSASAINPEDLESAKGQLVQSLSEYGATSQEVAKSLSSIDAVFNVQKQIGPALEKVREEFIKGKANDPSAQLEVLKKEVLSGANVSDDQKQFLNSVLDTFKLSDDDVAKIAGGNFEEIADNISKLLSGGVSDQLVPALKVISDNQKKLGELTRQRVELERKAVESYKASIDIQLEARQALEEFGGPAVKSADKLTAFNKKIDATLNLAGVGGVGAGSTGAIGAVSQQISEGLSQIASKRSTTAGITTEDSTQEDLLIQAQTELVDYTRDRLALVKEEISIQEKKNALEKSAFEKLLGGDIQGAIEDQAAAGAAKLLQAGETGLARLFGPQALLGGLKNLEETGASSNEKALAARTAATSLGVGSRLANAFAGATPEISALQGEGKKLASTLNNLGQAVANTDRMNVEAKSVIINTAQNLLRNQNAQVTNNPLGASEVTRSAAAQASVNKAAAGEAIAGLSPEVVKGFDTAINNFTAAVDKLQNMQLSVKLDTTNVNINFNGGSFLQNLSENIRGEVLKIVATEIPKYGQATDGTLQRKV